MLSGSTVSGADSPLLFLMVASAPFDKSNLMHSLLPQEHAMCNGVSPSYVMK